MYKNRKEAEYLQVMWLYTWKLQRNNQKTIKIHKINKALVIASVIKNQDIPCKQSENNGGKDFIHNSSNWWNT